MTNTIWKYELNITDRQVVSMPADSTILSVANQRGTLCLWALVDPAVSDKVDRDIEILGTGNIVSTALRSFIGTVVMEPFIWHVFERGRQRT